MKKQYNKNLRLVIRAGRILIFYFNLGVSFSFVHRATELFLKWNPLPFTHICVILYVKVPDAAPRGDRDFFQLNLKCFVAEYLSRNAADLHCFFLKIAERSTKEALGFLVIFGRLLSPEEGQLYCGSYSP